jgi:hypothetical protein
MLHFQHPQRSGFAATIRRPQHSARGYTQPGPRRATLSPQATKLVAGSITLVMTVGLMLFPSSAYAANPATVDLGTSSTFSALGSTGVANTGATTLSSDLGLSDSGLISGFPPGVVSGTTHDKNAAAAQAQTDTLAAFNELAGRTADATFAGDNNGRTYNSGVYYTASAFALTGTMILDAQGNPNAIFIFNIGAALNTAASSTVSLVNGAQPGNVYWRVLGAAGTGALANFSGTIIASGAVTLGAGSTLNGRVLSAGLVTLSSNTVITTAPATVPGAPTSVSATGGNANALVSWTAPVSAGGSAITGYTVTSSPGSVTATTSGSTSVTVAGLTNGTAYTFTVVATNAVGDSVASSASTAVTPAVPAVTPVVPPRVKVPVAPPIDVPGTTEVVPEIENSPSASPVPVPVPQVQDTIVGEPTDAGSSLPWFAGLLLVLLVLLMSVLGWWLLAARRRRRHDPTV